MLHVLLLSINHNILFLVIILVLNADLRMMHDLAVHWLLDVVWKFLETSLLPVLWFCNGFWFSFVNKLISIAIHKLGIIYQMRTVLMQLALDICNSLNLLHKLVGELVSWLSITCVASCNALSVWFQFFVIHKSWMFWLNNIQIFQIVQLVLLLIFVDLVLGVQLKISNQRSLVGLLDPGSDFIHFHVLELVKLRWFQALAWLVLLEALINKCGIMA